MFYFEKLLESLRCQLELLCADLATDLTVTCLGKNKIPEPPHTVHVVSVDVSRREVGEVNFLRHERPEKRHAVNKNKRWNNDAEDRTALHR